MKIRLFKNYILYTLLFVVFTCCIHSEGMDFKQITTKYTNTINNKLLTNEEKIKTLENLLEALKPVLIKELNPERKGAILLYISFIQESLAEIAEKNGDINGALAYLNPSQDLKASKPIFESIVIPLRFRLLYKYRNDNPERAAQYEIAYKQLQDLINLDPTDPLFKFANKNLAYSVYGRTLISEGKLKQGLSLLEKISPDNRNSLDTLQLFIAATFGYDDIAPDTKKATIYLKEIQNALKSAEAMFKPIEKSYYFVKGYLKLFGFGEKKNIPAGLKLIDEAENAGEDDIHIDINELFPQLEQIKQEYAAELAVKTKAQQTALADIDLWLAEEESKTPAKKTGKKKQPATSAPSKKSLPTASSSASADVESTTSQETNIPLTAAHWNAHFVPLMEQAGVDDQSRVTKIDLNNKTFTISDPVHDEELIVQASHIPVTSFQYLGRLDMAPRIAERQNTGNKQTDYNHTFAHMLDYVIQYVGDLVPYLQMGKEPKTTLITKVIRHNLKTGQKILCTAEYTFGKDFNAQHTRSFDVVYHRLLRPDKGTQSTKTSNAATQARSSNQ